jgi:hypothetical protein
MKSVFTILVLFAAIVQATVMSDIIMGPLAESIFAFSNGGAWDPGTRQFLHIGAPHGVSMQFILYREAENSWRSESMPSGNWGGAHTYDHLTLDTAGVFYHLYWSDGVTYRFNVRTNAWLSPLPSVQSGFGTLDYVQALNGLVRVIGGAVHLYRFSTGSWTTVRTGLAMGGLHTMACYSPVHKVLLFGGGDGNLRDIYLMDTSLSIRKLNAPPFDLGISQCELTCDPVTGVFLALSADSLRAYDIASDTWRGVTKNMIPSYGSHYSGAFAIPTYGVVMFTSSSAYPMLLYKHAGGTKAEAKVEAKEKGRILVSPNPVRGRAFVGTHDRTVLQHASVYDIRGNRIAAIDHNGIWNAAGVPAGIYIIKAMAHGRELSRRIVVE